jgi:DNA-directed RNA polymerase subunit RPC12/RpoP
MARDRQTAGSCSQCDASVECSYNRFEKDELRIDSWEHKCADCGRRETKAFRSDDSTLDSGTQTTVCPFCGRAAAS